MMYARIASAAVGLASVVLLGAGLGSYTVGGFNVREPVDVIGDATARVRKENFSADSAVPTPIEHVCKGCDAKLHREDAWHMADSLYDTNDEWAREEEESRDVVRVALADNPHAEQRAPAADGDADVVVNKDLVMYAGTVAHVDQ